jgi:4-amino-4-deoxy-L-arabinose transferase-like glycosyltransferase
VETRQYPHAWLRSALLWVAVCVGIVFLFLIFMAHNLQGLTDTDALDYAQIARNLAQGHGFSSDFLKPLTLTRVPFLDHHPDLIMSPLHPLLTSLFIRALGANDRAVALASALPFLLTLLVIFFLGARLFDRRVALLATAGFGVYLGTLSYSISGLEVCLLGLWVALLFLVLHRLPGEQKWLPALAVLAGVLLGCIYLTKEIWVVLLPPVLVYLYYSVDRSVRWKILGLTLGAFVVVTLPWCVRAAHLTGNPFFSWRWYEAEMGTLTNSGNTLYRSYQMDVPSPLTFLLYHPGEIYDKLLQGLIRLYGVPATLVGPVALSFFLVAILVPLGDASFERLRYVLYATFVLLCLALCWIMPSPRLLYPLAPLVAVIAAGLFLRVLTPLVKRYAPREQARALTWAVVLFLFLEALPLTVDLVRRTRPQDAQQMAQVKQLCRQVADSTSGVIVSDVPWLTAWYGGRTSLWLPRGWDDLVRLEANVGQIQYLLLTPTVANEQDTERTEEWVKLWSAAQSRPSGAYNGFVVYKLLGDNPPYWVLLRKAPAATGSSLPGGGGASG